MCTFFVPTTPFFALRRRVGTDLVPTIFVLSLRAECNEAPAKCTLRKQSHNMLFVYSAIATHTPLLPPRLLRRTPWVHPRNDTAWQMAQRGLRTECLSTFWCTRRTVCTLPPGCILATRHEVQEVLRDDMVASIANR